MFDLDLTYVIKFLLVILIGSSSVELVYFVLRVIYRGVTIAKYGYKEQFLLKKVKLKFMDSYYDVIGGQGMFCYFFVVSCTYQVKDQESELIEVIEPIFSIRKKIENSYSLWRCKESLLPEPFFKQIKVKRNYITLSTFLNIPFCLAKILILLCVWYFAFA